MVQRFDELEVFKRAYVVSLEIHKASLTFPQVEQYALANRHTQKRNSGDSFTSRLVLPMRCVFGCDTVSTLDISRSSNGKRGGMNTRR